MRSPLTPSHLLTFHHPFADDLIDCGFNEGCRDHLPVRIPVTEVVFVQKSLFDPESEVAKADLARIGGESDSTASADPVILAMDVEPVEVQVTPVESNLQDVMEVGDGAVCANQPPPPDHRADAANPGVELIDLDAAGFFHNTTRVSGNSGRPKREAIDYGEDESLFELLRRCPRFEMVSLIGTHHGVGRHQLQVYLDEFVFRHRRRRTRMDAFQTSLGLGTGRGPTSGNVIRGGHDLQQFPIKR
jgi:hypothetical protein